MFKVCVFLVSTAFVFKTAFAVELSRLNEATINAIFGEGAVQALKLDQLAKKAQDHEVYVLRSMIENGEASGGRDDIVGNAEMFGFCEAYLDILAQVVVDEKPAQVHMVHRIYSDESKKKNFGLQYGFAHVLRKMKGEAITTEAERKVKSEIVAEKTVKLNRLKIQTDSKKHTQLVEACMKNRPVYKDKAEDKFHVNRYKSVLQKLAAAPANDSSSNTQSNSAQH